MSDLLYTRVFYTSDLALGDVQYIRHDVRDVVCTSAWHQMFNDDVRMILDV